MEAWNRACPECLSDNLEKIGWGYFFCYTCNNIWEIVAPAGERSVIPIADAALNRNGTKNTKREQKKDQKQAETPRPGQWQEQNGIDYPL